MTTRNAQRGTRNSGPTVQALFRVLLAGAVMACGGQHPVGEPVTVTIPRGATFDAAVESLAAKGIVARTASFRLYARLRGLPGSLKSGTYTFSPDASWNDVVGALKRGRGAEVRFTVPEGLMLAEVAGLAAAQLRIPRDSFLAAARDLERLAELGILAGSVEGYLYPTTYVLPVGVQARDLVRLMTREFAAHWRPEWNGRLDTLELTRHQLVTLASIVQAEMRYRPDGPFIAAVYHNRLRHRMPLQADPTVIYAHGRRLRRVFEKQLQIRSPYNTYLHPGLPPGPISQPGELSLEAALYPAAVPFLYFVAQPDGKHVFSATYREHLEAIQQVRAGRRRRRRQVRAAP